MRRARCKRFRSLALGLAAWSFVGVLGAVAARGDEPALPKLVLIKPGTAVADSAPEGWSHLVLKSLPKIESGDIETLPSVAMSTATLFRTLILADVRPAKGAYRIVRVGLGVGVPVGKDDDKVKSKTDTVVNEENAAEPPFSLGFLEREVLSRVEAELNKARLVARTPTMAVLATPADLKVGSQHRRVFLLYAMLIDSRSGRLETLTWAVASRPERRTPPEVLIRLAPRLVCPCGLDVQADRLLGTVPVNWSFAACSLPPGDRVAASKTLRPWLSDLQRIASGPAEFERLLRAEAPTAARSTRP